MKATNGLYMVLRFLDISWKMFQFFSSCGYNAWLIQTEHNRNESYRIEIYL